jgi:hypothetical protein
MNRKSYAVLPAAIALTAGVVMLSDAASAQKAPSRARAGLSPTDTRLPSYMIAPEGGIAGVSFSENFEAFTPGPGCDQFGWAGFCGPAGDQVVFEIEANTPPDVTLGARSAVYNSEGSSIAFFDIQSPIFTLEPGRTDADITISDTSTLYQMVPVNNGAGFFNTRVHFELDGTIQALQVTDPACTVGVFAATTATWTPGVRMRIGVETDGTTLSIYKDGSVIFTGTDINSFCAPVAPAGIDQILFFSDNLTLGSRMQIDNIAPGGGATCVGDTNNSGAVDVDDLVAVILAWGPCPAPCGADVNNSGTVDVDDLVGVILAWGPC